MSIRKILNYFENKFKVIFSIIFLINISLIIFLFYQMNQTSNNLKDLVNSTDSIKVELKYVEKKISEISNEFNKITYLRDSIKTLEKKLDKIKIEFNDLYELISPNNTEKIITLSNIRREYGYLSNDVEKIEDKINQLFFTVIYFVIGICVSIIILLYYLIKFIKSRLNLEKIN